jgi:glyoxalase family protein
METQIPGIHHITAIASDPQQNIDFYMGVLGQRLVKKTVNFDDPGSYHFYFGDEQGHPGTIMTFFAWPGAPRGRQGAGQIKATAFSVPAGALDFWVTRLSEHGVTGIERGTRFGEEVLSFSDPDGLPLELIAPLTPDTRLGWASGPIPEAYAIRGFHSATLWVRNAVPSATLLTSGMGFILVGEEGQRSRYAAADERPGAFVDLLATPDAPAAYQAAGTVHHIAWRIADDVSQRAWRESLAARGLGVTDVRDRQYFRSIYFSEPGGILYEIATDPPGFAIDETPESLGTALKLPPWLERQRAAIERTLPSVHLPIIEEVRG